MLGSVTVCVVVQWEARTGEFQQPITFQEKSNIHIFSHSSSLGLFSGKGCKTAVGVVFQLVVM